MTPTADASGLDRIARLIQVAPVGIDDFSALRYLYAKSLIAQTAAAVSDEQVATLIRLIYSPYYSDLVMEEEVIGAWLDGELVGSAAWHPGREPTGVARIGPVFVRHPRFGIGSRLLGEVETRARRSGFRQFATWSATEAVPFFERQGYQVTSRGAKAFAPGHMLPVTFLRKDVA
jgi:GNAT superfamily N-acetyltransferase